MQFIRGYNNCLFWSRFAIVATVLVYIFYLFPSPDYCVFNKDDSSSFVSMGLNLVGWGRYSVDSFPLDNWGRHGTWPPIFPLMLSVPIAIFGLNWWALKALMALVGLVSLGLAWYFFRGEQRSGSRIADATTLSIAISPFFFLFSHVTMTEIPFIMATMIALILIRRINSPLTALQAGSACGTAFLVRGYAILFLPTLLFFLMSKKDLALTRRAILLACAVIPLLICIFAWWGGAKAFVHDHPLDSITATFGSVGGLSSAIHVPMTTRLKEVYWWHLPNLGWHFLPFLSEDAVRSNKWLALFGGLIGGLVTLGAVVCMMRGDRLIVPWTFCGVAFLVFMGMGNLRYSITYVPFYYYLFWTASDFIMQKLRLPKAMVIPLGVFPLLLLGAGLGQHLLFPDRLRFISPHLRDFSGAMVWAQKNLPENAVIFCERPYMAYGGCGIRSAGLDTNIDDLLVHAGCEGVVPTYWVINKDADAPRRTMDDRIAKAKIFVAKDFPSKDSIVLETDNLIMFKLVLEKIND